MEQLVGVFQEPREKSNVTLLALLSRAIGSMAVAYIYLDIHDKPDISKFQAHSGLACFVL